MLWEGSFICDKSTGVEIRINSSSSLRCARSHEQCCGKQNLQVGVRGAEVIEDLVLDILWKRC